MTKKFHAAWNNIEKWKKITLGIFSLNFFLVFQNFLPNLSQINVWDEADYVHFGKFLVEGQWPPLSWSPLTALFYGFLYLMLKNSFFWFLLSISIGRITAFLLLWLSTYLIAKELRKLISPLIIIALAAISPLFIDILKNPSDAFFAALTGLAFWQLLSYYHQKRNANLTGLSIYLGLASLLRNDGLILFAIVVIIITFLTYKQISLVSWLPRLVIPFSAIVGGYILLFWAVSGTLEIGTGKRSYIAFVQGHELVYQNNNECPYGNQKCAVLDANEKFGSAEENNHSVLKAITNNPGEYLIRVRKIIALLPERFFNDYGRQFSYFLLFFASTGILNLIFVRQRILLAILVLWISYLGVYFLTFFRTGYLQTPFFILFILAAFGIEYVSNVAHNNKHFFVFSLAVLTIIVSGVAFNVPSVYFNFAILFFAVLLIRFFKSYAELPQKFHQTLSVLTLIMAFMIVRDGYYPVIVGREFGQIPEEQALLTMVESFDNNTTIAAGSRGVVQAANMRYFALGNETIETVSPANLYTQLKEANVKGIYVDPTLSSGNKTIWRLIESEIGNYYQILYTGKDGSILVLKIQE